MTLLEDARLARLLPPPPAARSIRLSAGLSQARLAEEIGVHRMTLVRWETGERAPRGIHRIAYSRVLNDLQRAVMA